MTNGFNFQLLCVTSESLKNSQAQADFRKDPPLFHSWKTDCMWSAFKLNGYEYYQQMSGGPQCIWIPSVIKSESTPEPGVDLFLKSGFHRSHFSGSFQEEAPWRTFSSSPFVYLMQQHSGWLKVIWQMELQRGLLRQLAKTQHQKFRKPIEMTS